MASKPEPFYFLAKESERNPETIWPSEWRRGPIGIRTFPRLKSEQKQDLFEYFSNNEKASAAKSEYKPCSLNTVAGNFGMTLTTSDVLLSVIKDIKNSSQGEMMPTIIFQQLSLMLLALLKKPGQVDVDYDAHGQAGAADLEPPTVDTEPNTAKQITHRSILVRSKGLKSQTQLNSRQ